MFDVAVIGCGVIGAAAAYQLSKLDVNIAIIEAENDPAMVTTRANSGILHAGYDPKPGTVMAKMNVRGHNLAVEICDALDVEYNLCGGFVLAFSEEEMDHVRMLYDWGCQNGVKDLRVIDGEEARRLEPNLSDKVVGALYCVHTGVINPWEYTLAMAETAVRNGAVFMRSTRVTGFEKAPDFWLIHTTKGDVCARYVVNAAGLGAEELHNLVAAPIFKTTPNRGEYYLLDKSEGSTVSRVIFQCPSAAGKGVLVSPTVHGNIIVGPNADPVAADDNATTAKGLSYVAETAKKSVPGVNLRANIRNFAGVRANTDYGDFIIQESAPGFIDLCGMKSPGLSSAPAVGEECVKLLQKAGLDAPAREHFINERKRVRFAKMSPEEKKALIEKNPAYGRVICRCETITEGEIIDAIHEPIPPVSLDGIKRRCGTGMGRCQGGFCSPRVLEILAEELGLDPLEVTQCGGESKVLVGEACGGMKA